MYKGFVVDRKAMENNTHFSGGCTPCHKGYEEAQEKEAAHRGLVRRPSDDLNVCGKCHDVIANKYRSSLHFTTAGIRQGIIERFSDEEAKLFDTKVFENSCRNCHAACGDCHVKGPDIGGVSIGLIKGHRFIKKDESKTCAFCHGGRVYPEFTGQYGVIKDTHFEKGMMCLDCHKENELHGDGTPYTSRREVKTRPACADCHPPGNEKNDKANRAHNQHEDRLSCVACHALSTYKNCYNCHLGEGSTSKSGFILGRNPRDKNTVTTLRIVPTVRDTFLKAGIGMENYDTLPNYWDTMPHSLRKLTERTNNCNMCHLVKMGFLTQSALIKNGSKANAELIYTPRPINQH